MRKPSVARVRDAVKSVQTRQARFVAGLSDEQLGAVFERGPVRKVLIAAMVVALPRKFQRSIGGDIDGVIELRFANPAGGDPDRLQVTIRNGRCKVRRGGDARPDATATMRIVDLIRLAAASADAGWMMHDGKIKLSGDPMLFVRFPSTFGLPTRPLYAEPRHLKLVP